MSKYEEKNKVIRTSLGDQEVQALVTNWLESQNEDDNDPEVSAKTKRARGGRQASTVWDHFTKVKGTDPLKTKCNYCLQEYSCDPSTQGTSRMRAHMHFRCKSLKNPLRSTSNDNQQTLHLKPSNKGQELVPITFSQESCRKTLTEMVIIDELSFRFVEGEGFLNFCEIVCPRFKVPFRVTIARDCLSMYLKEKKMLKSALKSYTICLTIDTWTSLQNINYMCLTAHYIDSEWRLTKRILNFCVVVNHKGETIGRMVEKCLIDWGIDKILTITCDNESSNNTAIECLKKKTKHWTNIVLAHEFLHIRCFAYILNLVVKDGLKQFDVSIARVRDAVRYARSSPARWSKWKKCAKDDKIESKKNVCLDVQTRWNSRYLMLETAVKFEEAFVRLEEEDRLYVDHFDGKDDVCGLPPGTVDWDRSRLFVQFLKVYYTSTTKIYGSNYVTSDLLFNEIVSIKTNLKVLCYHSDIGLKSMGTIMVEKYDKYWDLEKINPLLLVAVVLDPRFKLDYIGFGLAGLYVEDKISLICDKVEKTLHRLFESYVGTHNPNTTSHVDTVANNIMEDPVSKWKRLKRENLGNASEVDKYLKTDVEDEVEGTKFEILSWWKNNCVKYPVFSLIARDILAIPVTSVASESTFSTGRRILDPFRSSLRPNTVEALICTQNWLRTREKPIDLQASMEEIE